MINTPQLNISNIPIKPTILFDIDGVLNAYLHGESKPWNDTPDPSPTDKPFEINAIKDCHFSQEHIDNGFPPFATIQWSTELAKLIYNFHKTTDVQYIWLTSWDDVADELSHQCLWQNLPSPMTGYLSTETYFDPNRAKRMAVFELRNFWLKQYANHTIDTIPPIIHFDDIYVRDIRYNNEIWFNENHENTHIKMSTSPYLFIQTNPKCGITKRDWQTATKFIKGE